LQTKHADKKMVNIDSIPDVKLSAQDFLQQPLVGYCSESGGDGGMNLSFLPVESMNTIHDNNLDNLDDTLRCFGTGISGVAGNVNNISTGKLLGGSGGFPLDLSKSPLIGTGVGTTLKYEPSESEISYSDSNNDESQDCFLSQPPNKTMRNQKTPLSSHSDLLDIATDNDLEDSENNFLLSSPASSSQGSQQPNQQFELQQQKKRFRTPMSSIQIKILRILFTDIKMPTMIDCENIGRVIGLSKRVIQVIV
jgi:hypothetical protein